ncbi:MAG: hypothetical protein ABIJ09_22125 [Pseudomonadota bacterium]
MKVSVKKGQNLSQILRDKGVPAKHVAEAAKQVAQLNQLKSAKDVKPGTTLEFPDSFTVAGKTFNLGNKGDSLDGLQKQTPGAQHKPARSFNRTQIEAQAKQQGKGPGSGGEPIFIMPPGGRPGTDGPYYIIAPDGRTRPGTGGGPIGIMPPPGTGHDGPLYILPPPGTGHDGPIYIMPPPGTGHDGPLYIMPPPGTGHDGPMNIMPPPGTGKKGRKGRARKPIGIVAPSSRKRTRRKDG